MSVHTPTDVILLLASTTDSTLADVCCISAGIVARELSDRSRTSSFDILSKTPASISRIRLRRTTISLMSPSKTRPFSRSMRFAERSTFCIGDVLDIVNCGRLTIMLLDRSRSWMIDKWRSPSGKDVRRLCPSSRLRM